MRARSNPYGLPRPEDVTIIQVGERGDRTHIYDPNQKLYRVGVLVRQGVPLCGSGYKSGASPDLYRSDANFVTCTRCIKLYTMNQQKGGKARG